MDTKTEETGDRAGKNRNEEERPERAPVPGLRVRTAVRAGWTYTNGGIEHEDTWDAQR